MGKFDIPKAKAVSLGWTKLSYIAKVDSGEQVRQLLKEAKSMSCTQLNNACRRGAFQRRKPLGMTTYTVNRRVGLTTLDQVFEALGRNVPKFRRLSLDVQTEIAEDTTRWINALIAESERKEEELLAV